MDKCKSIEEYVNIIISMAHTLNGVGLNVPDEWIGTLLLAGLPDEYRPMIMGLESSGTPITSDAIKTKLLQKVKSKTTKGTNSETAFYTKKSKFKKKSLKCYRCNAERHFANKCPEKPENSEAAKKEPTKNKVIKNRTFLALLSANGNPSDAWYVDSCASTHITTMEIIYRRSGHATAPPSLLPIVRICGLSL